MFTSVLFNLITVLCFRICCAVCTLRKMFTPFLHNSLHWSDLEDYIHGLRRPSNVCDTTTFNMPRKLLHPCLKVDGISSTKLTWRPTLGCTQYPTSAQCAVSLAVWAAIQEIVWITSNWHRVCCVSRLCMVRLCETAVLNEWNCGWFMSLRSSI